MKGAKKEFRQDDVLRLHAVLHRVRERLEREGIVAREAFRAYDDAGVTPSRIDKGKGAHLDAILELAEAIATSAPKEAVPYERGTRL